ncbi:hypothetical protein NC651_023635 [Populus alba x Populus x berolinensis]|nr:hypothetical protein NC651_023635 [Populus alba x Populus x berolinensis]
MTKQIPWLQNFYSKRHQTFLKMHYYVLVIIFLVSEIYLI